MIQVNLLPSVKQEYLKSQQTKQLFIAGSLIASLSALVILGLLFGYVQVVQPQHRANLQKDIDSGIKTLKANKDGVKVVTVENALKQLPGLEDKKPLTSRFFGYLTGVTPKGISYSEVNVDYSTSTVNLNGTASTYEQANALANNLKNAKLSYTMNDQTTTVTPFSNVVFQGLSKGEQVDTGKPVALQVTFSFGAILFNQAATNLKLQVDSAAQLLGSGSDAQPFGTTSGGAQ